VVVRRPFILFNPFLPFPQGEAGILAILAAGFSPIEQNVPGPFFRDEPHPFSVPFHPSSLSSSYRHSTG
jgi:hypothetical protein